MTRTTIDVTVSAFDDGYPGLVAQCDEFPGMLGHGEDHAEALADLVEQIEMRTLH